ncbi:MAG: ribosomal protein S18-alanine N-acetyltransferase [Cellvibrionaceae bacterium]|nr:ribosomal protein S18-alanine N-acetyltransferase [Cellvibrionaceae bacterium]
MSPEPKLAPVTAADLEALLKIEQQAHSHPWPASQFEQRLGGRSQLQAALVQGDKILGYYFASQVVDQAELLNIAVAPAAQGRGFGRLLLQHLIGRLDPAVSELFLEVRASNTPAIGLYEALGFNQVGLRQGYYPRPEGGREDALLYAYTLMPQ